MTPTHLPRARRARPFAAGGGLLALVTAAGCVMPGPPASPTPTPGTQAPLSLREATDALCSDGLDNDRDGHTDCDDRACVYTSTVSVCGRAPSAEDNDAACSDGRDNDGDPYIDCQDDDCLWNGRVSVCDRDRDGARPSEGDCFDHPTLDLSLAVGPGVPEMCGDGEDNDCDGVAEESSCIQLDLGMRPAYVIDGDTLGVDGLGHVRLKGIDTPESWQEGTGDAECYGLEAKARTTTLVGQLPVRVVLDPVDYVDGFRDLYGRLLGHVYVGEEGDRYLNGTLVEEGFACVWTGFECYDKVELLELQSQAQADDVGLWGECGPSVCF